MRIPWKPGGLALFLAVWFVYSVCPPFLSYDSYWTVPTALSILRHGTTRVDEFVASAPPAARYALECVLPSGPPLSYQDAKGCPDGHWYNRYPLAVSILSLPLVVLTQFAADLLGHAVPRSGLVSSQPVVAAFLSGDFIGGRAPVELWCASTFGAISVWLEYQLASLFLSRPTALGLALLFAFGTPQWSVASRNLMQHGLSVLLLTVAIYLLLLGREEPFWIPYAAVPLALAFTVRPWAAVSVVVLTLYVAIHHRRQLIPFLLWASPVALLYFGYNLIVRHTFLLPYLNPGRAPRLPFYDGLLMHLFSPARGMVIFTPIVILSAVGMILSWRLRWCFPLAPYLAAIIVLHTALLASFWPGHGYGPRYFSDMSALFVLFLIPVILYWRKLRTPWRNVTAGVFLFFAAWGVFIHGRGATSIAANKWSALPVSVDEATWRVWDWTDPQFLRGLH